MEEASGQYVWGRSPEETRRLHLQAQFYTAHSEHLLRLAGLGPGMRVLDVGCGAGDVSMLAARLVGPTGSVIGIDVDVDILDLARRRTAAEGLHNVHYQKAAIPEIPLDQPVDALVGRLILVHLADPVAAIRSMSGLVRPGGVISFQDINTTRARSVPQGPLARQVINWICDGLRAAGRDPDHGDRLAGIFQAADLPTPQLAVSVPATTDPESEMYDLEALTLEGILPVIEKGGIATRSEIDPDTILGRLRAEGRNNASALFLPELVGAWARLPSSPARQPYERPGHQACPVGPNDY